jgi:hypothetical protein
MWQKLKEQIPAVIITAALVIAAAAVMVKQIVRQQRAELEPLRVQNEMLRMQGEENRRQIEATTKLLKDAITRYDGEGLRTEEQVARINDERLTRLAQVIAQRVIPELPGPKSPADVQKAENEQVDKVAARLTENIRPVLASAMAEQQAAGNDAVRQSEARTQQLNVGMLAMQAAAQDALRLSHELSALYLESYRDRGVLTRLVTLPVNLVIDAANLNFVHGDRAKAETDVRAKINDIDKRLREIRSMAGVTGGN